MSQYRNHGPGDEALAPDADRRFIGVNARLAPAQLGPGLAARAYNLRMRDGTVATRLGVAKPKWLNALSGQKAAAAGTLYGAGVWQDPNGFEWVLIAADGNIYRHQPHTPRCALNLPAGVRLLGTCTFCGAFDRVYCFRGRHLAPLVMTSVDTGWEDLIETYDAAEAYQSTLAIEGIEGDEVAYGPLQAVSSITRAGDVATATTASPHGYVSGADVIVAGADQAEYNGRVNITVTGDLTFTYAATGSPATPATGTVTVHNRSHYWAARGSVLEGVTLSASGRTVTGSKTSHGLEAGWHVTIANATDTRYNGTWRIENATEHTFTFTAIDEPEGEPTVSVQASQVLAGQDPETNPEAWERVYNVLPNADEGVFVGNRLLVPTAYTPGDDGYDESASWTKKDFLVLLDIGDPVHFSFFNELRINQGSDDQIQQVLKYNNNSVVILKDKSWGILTGLTGSYTNLALDMRLAGHGACGPRAGVVTGANVLFASARRGICGLRQNEQGQTLGVDVPFSNEFQAEIDRVNWAAADKIRLAYWDDRLYCAVPLDGSLENNAVLVYDFRRESGQQVWAGALQVGQWEGVDTALNRALAVKEWFQCHVDGQVRLCYIAEDGWANVMEAAAGGDEIASATHPDGVVHQAVAWELASRGYGWGSGQPKRYGRALVTLDNWAGTVSVSANTGAAGSAQTLRSGLTWSRSTYLKPAGRPAYAEGNANGDWAAPGRGDYSVRLLPGGIAIAGWEPGRWQELGVRVSLRTLAGSYAQLTLAGTGRVRIKTIEPEAGAGQRRAGILV